MKNATVGNLRLNVGQLWWTLIVNLGLVKHTFKCEGKFVPDSPMIHVATEHVQCTGLGWWENRISGRLYQTIRGKL